MTVFTVLLSLVVVLVGVGVLWWLSSRGEQQETPAETMVVPAPEIVVTSTLTVHQRGEILAIADDGVAIVNGWSPDLKGREFRYADDLSSVIRLSQEDPPGYRLESEVAVAGISYEPTCTHATALIAGKDRRLVLERDADNAYDSHAVKVIGHWTDSKGREGCGQVGWVPKDIAQEIDHLDERGTLSATLWKMFKPSNGQSPGLRMDIWYAPAPRIEKPKKKRQKPTVEREDLRDMLKTDEDAKK